MNLEQLLHVRKAPRLFGSWRRKNVREPERWVSLVAGLGITALALRRWKARGVAVAAAGMLLRRGLTGNCPVYRKLGVRTT
jgi:uncharacterized membrane protein